ncbi:MAG TPA: Mpo1-like protein [Planktothrix sp.]|jgi:uncharacterized membrane protein YGL010W
MSAGNGNNGAVMVVDSSTAVQDFDHNLAYYKSQHLTVGCKITHMIGIPMIAASFFVLPFNRRRFAELQAVGWFLQFLGHFAFEHNKPVLLEVRSPYTVASALVFVYEEWKRFASKQPL